MMAILRPGDTVVVQSLDRLGRDYEEMIYQLDIITHEKDAFIVVLDMPILDSRNKYGDDLTAKLVLNLVIQIFSYVAQMERENIKQRQAEGIAAAQARGVRFGRPKKKRPACYASTKESYLGGHLTRQEAATRLKVSASTFDRWLKEDATDDGND